MNFNGLKFTDLLNLSENDTSEYVYYIIFILVFLK